MVKTTAKSSKAKSPKTPAKDGKAAGLPFSTQFDLTSKISGRVYRIFVFRPPVPPPDGGYPVVYFSDGNLAFPIAMAMGGAFSLMAGNPVMVVGVGYPSDNPLDLMARTRDLTPPTPLSAIIPQPGLPPLEAENFGGADDFRRFLTEELRPRLAARHSIDPANQTLSGYSLGGLFTLHVLFNHPNDFSAYAACSPSIWWNKRAVLKGEKAFAKQVESKVIAPRVLVTIGSEEQTPPPVPPPGMTPAQVRKLLRQGRMVDNARELGERLAALKGGPGYVARFQAFEREDHLTSIAAAISRTLAFALRP